MKKTALVLSGGGSRGGYEIGVWEALRELNITPDMVFGTSVGAINAAMVAQGKLELSKSLWQQLETDMVFDIDSSEEKTHSGLKKKISDITIAGMPAENAMAYAKEIILSGGAGNTGLMGLLNKCIDEKSVRASGLIYGLVVTELPGLAGRYMTLENIPQGLLVSYIMASASCFPAVQKCVIGQKTYIDGGYNDNMPVEMALKNGATHIIAVNLEAAGILRHDTIKRAKNEAEDFRIIKSSHDLGSFLLFDKKNTARLIKLGYLDAMKSFGKYDGQAFTFKKGALDRHQLLGAENAAKLLALDPCIIYTPDTLVAALAEHLAEYGKASAAKGYSLDTSLTVKELVAQITKDLSDGDFRIFLLCYIAASLIKDEASSIFLKPPLFNLLEGDIKAGNFLIQHGLIK